MLLHSTLIESNKNISYFVPLTCPLSFGQVFLDFSGYRKWNDYFRIFIIIIKICGPLVLNLFGLHSQGGQEESLNNIARAYINFAHTLREFVCFIVIWEMLLDDAF